MKRFAPIILLLSLMLCSLSMRGQTDSTIINTDSINNAALKTHLLLQTQMEQRRIADSTKKAQLELELSSLKTVDNVHKQELIDQLKAIENNEAERLESKKASIAALLEKFKGSAVIGAMDDTLFIIYTKLGSSQPKERANRISQKIKTLYKDDFLVMDSILAIKAENTYDIIYGETIIMSISETDAMCYDKEISVLAQDFVDKIKSSITQARKENSWLQIALRIFLVLLVLAGSWLCFRLIGLGNIRWLKFFNSKKELWLKDLSYKNYTFLTKEQELTVALFLFKVVRWFIYVILLYITLPIIFSVFPFSRNWADALFQLIWSPLKGIMLSVWIYFPNLITILVIYYVMKYVIRFVKYIFSEIQDEKLVLEGFHADWAMPTFSIVKFLLYAFMFVLIFPYLPGSDSNIFKGVSVFIGVLFSLGSSSAIANMVAGLVITYMRPFKIGDRIKIADATGDVIEKTLLVTRIRTPKNEVITIPNSSVLSGNTINYTSETKQTGLIIHTTVTIGYDVPWKDMHQTLIDAALRTEHILHEPLPFVLQTSLEDFYVAYQINAYIKEAGKQAGIYSNLHQNIQDVCNENGIEILSPHYRAARDGNNITIPANYLPEDYKAPGFNVNMKS